jgi:hypothetical protein
MTAAYSPEIIPMLPPGGGVWIQTISNFYKNKYRKHHRKRSDAEANVKSAMGYPVVDGSGR